MFGEKYGFSSTLQIDSINMSTTMSFGIKSTSLIHKSPNSMASWRFVQPINHNWSRGIKSKMWLRESDNWLIIKVAFRSLWMNLDWYFWIYLKMWDVFSRLVESTSTEWRCNLWEKIYFCWSFAVWRTVPSFSRKTLSKCASTYSLNCIQLFSSTAKTL